jgi:hypothetical protein
LLRKLNTKRVALSIGLAGAIVAPLGTGSLVRFVKHPVDGGYFETPTTDAELSCSISELFPSKDGVDRAACDKANSEPKPKDIYISVSLDPKRTPPLVRDVLIGFFVPALLVLLVPPYLRWLTS